MGVRILLCPALVLLLGAAGTAHAQGGPELSEIREMVLYARYRDAIAAARAYLEDESLSAETRNAALEVLATAQIANRDMDDARATLATLYSRDPGHRLSDPDASPTVLSAFARARDAGASPVHVELGHEAPGMLPARGSPEVEVRLGENGDAVSELRLQYRYGGDERYATLLMVREGDRATARIPLSGQSGAYDVEYFIQAAAPSGVVLAEAGSAAEPLVARVPEAASSAPMLGPSATTGSGEPRDEGSSVLGQWWFWGAVVLVLGGGVAAYVLLGPPSDGPPDGSLGNVSLGIR